MVMPFKLPDKNRRPDARPGAGRAGVRAAILLLLVLCTVLGAGAAAAGPPIDPLAGPLLSGGLPLPSRPGEAGRQVTWVKHAGNPVLSAGPAGSWDDAAVGLPSLLAADGGYLMWYSGGNTVDPGLRIGLAASSDGLGWTKAAGNPVLTVGPPGGWDSGCVTAPNVIYRDGLYRMWYRGTQDSDRCQQAAALGYATSPDGTRWTRYAANPVLTVGAADAWDGDMVWSASVLAEAGGYKMWYSACRGGRCRIGCAASPDGISWTKHAGNPVLDVGPAGAWDSLTVYYPNVIRAGGAYEMWYTGFDGRQLRIGHATSADGVAWTRDPANPVLAGGPAGSWDRQGVLAAPVIAQPGAARMWYTGWDEAGIFRVGAATEGLRAYLPVIRR